MKKSDFIERLEELQNDLRDRDCRPSDALVFLRENVERYWIREAWEELRESYKTYQELQEMIRDALDSWINRLYYFLNDVNLYDVEIMYIDNYGNCDHTVSYKELWELIESIIEWTEKTK